MGDWQALGLLFDQAPGDWSACVQLPGGETVYAYAADQIRPAASLIKVPLAMALIDAAHGRLPSAQKIDLDRAVTLREEDRVEGDGAFDAAPVGTVRTLHELIGHTLRESDNTAGNLLIVAIGMDAVNDYVRAAPLALQTTRLQRRFMDVAAAAAGRENLTTAREMCAIFATLLSREQDFAPILAYLKCSPYTERLVAGLPARTVVAHKVGDLDGIAHDAGVVYHPQETYIVALLSTHLPDVSSGNRTMEQASRLIFQRMIR